MRKLTVGFYALCLSASTAFASASLTRDQLKHFDMALADQEKAQCLTQGPAVRETWLLGEIKKMGEADPQVQNLTRNIWYAQVLDFKIDDENAAATWIPTSLGTFGILSGKPFQAASKDGQSLTANLIDGGKGTKAELNAAKNIQGAFWLVEKSDSIPDIAALSLEAKSRGAAGLIIYENKKALVGTVDSSSAEQTAPWPVPMVEVSQEVARKIKDKLKGKPVQASLSVKTEYPVVEAGHGVLVKKGSRDQQAFIVVNEDDCFAIGKSLAFFKWIDSGGVPVQGTTFAFFNQKSFSENKFIQDWAHPAVQLNMAEAGESNNDAVKFLNRWFKSDQNPDDVFDVKPVLKKANAIQKDLKGLVSGEELKKYGELLKQIEKPSRAPGAVRSPVNYKLAQIVEPVEFSEMVSDLKFLRLAHGLAEKGQWDQAISALKHVTDFQWADNVSLETFLDYEKQKVAAGAVTADPAIWVEIQKGKRNVDVLLELLERDIDRLDHQLSDNFFKLQKSIEEFQKI